MGIWGCVGVGECECVRCVRPEGTASLNEKVTHYNDHESNGSLIYKDNDGRLNMITHKPSSDWV